MATKTKSLFSLFLRKNTILANNFAVNRYNVQTSFSQFYATKAEKKKGIDRKRIPKIEYTAQSIRAKGFLRPGPDYTPASDYKQRLDRICTDLLGNCHAGSELGEKKCEILMAANDELEFSVPNSLLHQIITIGDLMAFYGEAVSTKTPLDKMRQMELPANLHVQFEYNRWHPDTDTKFGGVTAFPGSSTLVTGLKYRNKYKGHRQEIPVLRE